MDKKDALRWLTALCCYAPDECIIVTCYEPIWPSYFRFVPTHSSQRTASLPEQEMRSRVADFSFIYMKASDLNRLGIMFYRHLAGKSCGKCAAARRQLRLDSNLQMNSSTFFD
jgi:hypothetical protein